MRRLATLIFVLASVSLAFAQPARQLLGADATRPFSAAVKAGGLIYIAGTTAVDASNKTDIGAQTTNTLRTIDATLRQAGSSLANAASTTVYLRKASDFDAMNQMYARFFPKDPPARTTVVVTQPLANPDALVEIAVVAVPSGAERVVVHPNGWLLSPAPYSYGIKSGNTLFLAGLVSRNGKDNSNVKGDITAQTKTVFENAAAVLKQAGMSFADVVSARVYLTDEYSFQPMNAAYRAYFPAASMPARATVKVGLTSPDYLLELTMVAAKDPNRKTILTPNPDGTPGIPNPNLSSAIQAGARLYLAGIPGNTSANTGDVKAQTEESLARIERTLKTAGYDWSNVHDSVVYLQDMKDYQTMNAVYRAKLGKDFPARATVGVGLMGTGAAVEIMMTASK